MTGEVRVVAWQGELLWPRELPEGEVIDCSSVVAMGSWTCAWFRQHPRTAVVGASRQLRRQLQAAGLPILWYAAVDEALAANRGVSASERAMLWEQPEAAGREGGDG